MHRVGTVGGGWKHRGTVKIPNSCTAAGLPKGNLAAIGYEDFVEHGILEGEWRLGSGEWVEASLLAIRHRYSPTQ